MTTVLTLLIRIYQATISPLLGSRCRFSPTCSNYAIEALQRFGLLKGGWLAGKRLLKCQPLSSGGYDTVPPHTLNHN